jgi:hypothetical protein
VATHYPNTTDMAQASKVVVKSGEEVRGIDIAVKMEIVNIPPPAPKPTGGVKISGLVIDGLLPRIGGGSLPVPPAESATTAGFWTVRRPQAMVGRS